MGKFLQHFTHKETKWRNIRKAKPHPLFASEKKRPKTIKLHPLG